MDAQKRIRKVMDERGWTDYLLAKEANLSHSTVTIGSTETIDKIISFSSISIVMPNL